MINFIIDDRFVTIHVGGMSKGGGGTLGGGGRRTLGDAGTLGGRGDFGGTTKGRQRFYTRSIDDITLISLRRCDVDVSRCQSQRRSV